MDILAAVDGGIWGTVLLTLILFAGRLLRASKMDYVCLLGELILPPGPRAHGVGLVLHLLNGIVFGLLYAALATLLMTLFGVSGLPPPTLGLQLLATLIGGLLGLYHYFIQLPLTGAVADLHARIRRRRDAIPEDQEPWGFFYRPSELMLALAAHVAYGAVFGLTVVSGVGVPTLIAGLAAYAGLGILSIFAFGEAEQLPGAVAFLREEERAKTEH